MSDQEVPGFHARTTIDDAIAKLTFIRQQLSVVVPEDVDGLLDDIDEKIEAVISLVEDLPLPIITNSYGRVMSWPVFHKSGSEYLERCSCGTPRWEYDPKHDPKVT